MHQPALFSLPPAYAITIRLDVNGTWTMVVASMSSSETWDDSSRSTYTDLSLSEALDVIAGELFKA